MRLLLIMVSVLLSTSFLQAQTNEIDSLKRVLVGEQIDTSRVLLLNSLAYKLHRPDPRKGIEYASESVLLAKKISYEKGLAHAYNSMGACYWNLTELDSAIKYYQKSFTINDKLGRQRGTTGALSNIAIIYENKGDYVNAINTYTQALEIMENERFVDYAAITTNNLGIALMNIGSYPEALEYFHKSFNLADSLEMTHLIGPVLINIGRIYGYLGEPKLELESKMKALKIGEEADDPFVMALVSNNIGNFYRSRRKLDTSLIFFKKAMEMNESMGRKSSIILNLSNIGVVYREQGLFDESFEILKKALSIARDVGQSLRISRVNYQLGLTIKEQIGCEAALPYFLEGYEIAKKGNRLREIENVSSELYQCYQILGNYNQAYKYLMEYTSTGDSLINEENIKEMAKIESKYQFENQIKAKNTEIRFLESREEIANLQITLLVIGVILVAIIAFSVSRFMILKRERRKQELEAIAKFRESMTGMIAHDLKTPLSVIMNSSSDEKSNKQMAGQMLQLINNMLDVHRFESTEVKLEKENASLQSLVESAENHVGFLLKEKDLALQVDDDQDYILNVDKSVMVRVFVNLLTNAIKYSPFNEVIKITSTIRGGKVEIAIIDKGAGISEEQKELIFKSFGQLDPKDSGGIGSTGLGLTFVKLALKAHQSDIQVNSKRGEGTKFSFELPLLSTSTIDVESIKQTHKLRSPIEKISSKRLEKLRSFNVHQIGEIEKELSAIKGKNRGVEQWIEHVLNSAYSGNEEKYKELLS